MVVTDVTSVSHNAMVEVQKEWVVLVGGGIPSLLYLKNAFLQSESAGKEGELWYCFSK